MQVAELLKLTKWFDANIVESGIPQKYSALYNKMNKNINRPQNIPIIPFKAEKENLCNAVKTINFQSLSIEQFRFLEKKLEITGLLGENGINLIEDILFKNHLDLASAVDRIKKEADKVNQAAMTITELKTTLEKSFSITDIENEIEDGSVLMRIYFQNDVAINNIVDLKQLSKTWYDIGRGVTMAHGKCPEDLRIIGVEKGSIIIDLVVIACIAKTVCTIFLEILKVTGRVLDIMKQVEEIKALRLTNDSIVKDLEKEADLEKEQGLKLILDATIVELGLSVDAQGDKINALTKSIKELTDFMQKGGDVDIVQPQEINLTEQNIRVEHAELALTIKEIRKLKNKIKLEDKLLTTTTNSSEV